MHGKCRNLLDIVCFEQHTRQALQRSTADTDTADVFNAVAIALHKRCSRTHTYHNHAVDPRFIACTKSVG